MSHGENICKPSRRNGFTLIELLISLALFLIALSAIFGILRLANIQRNTINTRTDALNGAKFSLNYIRKDAINAGLGYHLVGGIAPDNFAQPLLNMPADADVERDFLTGIMAGNDVNPNALNPAKSTDTIAFVSRDVNFNGGNLINFTATSAAANGVNVQTAQAVNDVSQPFDLYLLEFGSGTSQIVGMATGVPDSNTIQFAAGDPLGLNQTATGAGSNQSLLVSGGSISGTLKRINLVSYSVTNDGVLIRKTYGNKSSQDANVQIETRELIYGVKDFQIQYVLENGTTTDDPSNGNDGQNNQKMMNKVVEIQMTITVVQDDNGLPQASAPITFKETVSTRNLHYPNG